MHCEECERGWLAPNDVEKNKPGFLTLMESFETEMPSKETIESFGWGEFINGEFDE